MVTSHAFAPLSSICPASSAWVAPLSSNAYAGSRTCDREKQSYGSWCPGSKSRSCGSKVVSCDHTRWHFSTGIQTSPNHGPCCPLPLKLSFGLGSLTFAPLPFLSLDASHSSSCQLCSSHLVLPRARRCTPSLVLVVLDSLGLGHHTREGTTTWLSSRVISSGKYGQDCSHQASRARCTAVASSSVFLCHRCLYPCPSVSCPSVSCPCWRWRARHHDGPSVSSVLHWI